LAVNGGFNPLNTVADPANASPTDVDGWNTKDIFNIDGQKSNKNWDSGVVAVLNMPKASKYSQSFNL
jgi:hypothetical protein